MFADDILKKAKKELKDFIIFESENIYNIDSSAATDTTRIDEMDVNELAALANELETTYYKVLKKQK